MCHTITTSLLTRTPSQGSLHDAMQSAAEKDSFTWSRSLKILEHALKGIVGLHSWKPQIVHRDLKSMNLLVDDNWNVKVRQHCTLCIDTHSRAE